MRIELKGTRASLGRLDRVLARAGKDVNKLLVTAVNDTAKQVRTRMSTKIRDHVNIKKKDVDQHIKFAKAEAVPATVIKLSETARFPLKYFGAKANSRGVTYRIKKGSGRQFVPGAFGPPGGKRTGIARLGFHVYRREDKSRLPIRKLFGPSPYGVFKENNLLGSTVDEGNLLLQRNIDRRLNLMLLRMEGKVNG